MRKILKKWFRCCVAVIMLFATLCACSAFTLTGSAKIKYSGKGEATLTVRSDLDETAFKQSVADYVEGFATQSGESDRVTLKSVKKTDDGYAVQVSFRRIDKVKVMGECFLSKTSAFVEESSETGEMIRGWESGYFATTQNIMYKDTLKQIDIDPAAYADGTVLRKANGDQIDVEELSSYAKKAGENSTVAAFRLLDVSCIESVRVSFPADVLYYAGGDVELIDDNTVEIRPTLIEATIVSTEGGAIDTKTEQIGTIFAYVVYEKGLSPLAIVAIVIGSLLIVGLIVAFLLHIWKLSKNAKKSEKESGSSSVGDEIAPAVSSSCESLEKISSVAPSKAVFDVETSAIERQAAGIKDKEKSCFSAGWEAFCNSRAIVGIKRHKLLYLLLLPAFLFVLIFNYAPMFGLVIAFEDFKLLDGVFGSEFVGMKTFRKILFAESPGVYRVFRNTIYISLIRIATNMPAILAFTLLLNEIKSKKAKSAVQIISYIPNFISWIAVGGMAYNLFSSDGGILNRVLTMISGNEVDIKWYSENKYWWGILAISSLWKGMGWGTLIYMSALGGIDDELYDACTIDGGGRFRQAMTVTLPGIMSVVMLQLIMDVSSIMGDNYEQIIAMINGSQALTETTNVIGTVAFNSVLGGSGYTGATAYGLIQGVIGLVLVLFTNRIVKKTDNEGIL